MTLLVVSLLLSGASLQADAPILLRSSGTRNHFPDELLFDVTVSDSVDSDSECVWVSITKRIETFGLPKTEEELPLIDWTKSVMPRRITKTTANIGKARS